jgi:hypothetical protein
MAASVLICALGVAALVSLPVGAPAQDAKSATAEASESEEEKQDRDARRACTVAICAALHNRSAADGQIDCNLRKTWRKDAISKLLAPGKVSWPWGDTRCGSAIRVDRTLLVKAMQEPEFHTQLDAYSVRCQIRNAGDAQNKYDVSIRLRPEVTFKQGKATKVTLRYEKVEAPMLAKAALWPILAADSAFGLLQSRALDDINGFIGSKCMEVKAEWQAR